MDVKTLDAPNGYLAITNAEWLFSRIQHFDKSHYKALQKDAKKIAEPIRSAVEGAIPSSSPIRGMSPKVIPGRVTWGTGKPAHNTKTQIKATSRETLKYRSLVRVISDSAATVIADMAGRTGEFVNKRHETRVYPYSKSPTGVRKHRINGQGRGMIKALDARYGHKPSRMAWPAAEKNLHKVQEEMADTLAVYCEYVNARMRSQ